MRNSFFIASIHLCIVFNFTRFLFYFYSRFKSVSFTHMMMTPRWNACNNPIKVVANVKFAVLAILGHFNRWHWRWKSENVPRKWFRSYHHYFPSFGEFCLFQFLLPMIFYLIYHYFSFRCKFFFFIKIFLFGRKFPIQCTFFFPIGIFQFNRNFPFFS